MASFQVQRYAFSNATADDYQIVTGLTGKKIGVTLGSSNSVAGYINYVILDER